MMSCVMGTGIVGVVVWSGGSVVLLATVVSVMWDPSVTTGSPVGSSASVVSALSTTGCEMWDALTVRLFDCWLCCCRRWCGLVGWWDEYV